VILKGLLIDLDGVLYIGTKPVPGARKAIEFLDDSGYSYRFVSNTTRKSRRSIAKHLQGLGFDIAEDLIFTPTRAAVQYIKNTGKSRISLLSCGDVNLDLGTEGLSITDESPDFVVIGDAGDNFSYESLNNAFRMVLGGAGIIALEKDRYWMGDDGLMLSAGPFVAGLEYATGKTSEIMGKPSPHFFRLALESMNISPQQAVMIGDDVVTDVGGAISAGLSGVLVRTGKFREDALNAAKIPPDMIIDSIADIEQMVYDLDRGD
jgi:HAD superfamily hydrolase (TIGR01458 family)